MTSAIESLTSRVLDDASDACLTHQDAPILTASRCRFLGNLPGLKLRMRGPLIFGDEAEVAKAMSLSLDSCILPLLRFQSFVTKCRIAMSRTEWVTLHFGLGEGSQ